MRSAHISFFSKAASNTNDETTIEHHTEAIYFSKIFQIVFISIICIAFWTCFESGFLSCVEIQYLCDFGVYIMKKHVLNKYSLRML